jgi:hypothetical protein
MHAIEPMRARRWLALAGGAAALALPAAARGATSEVEQLRSELSSTQQELTTTKEALVQTRQELAATRGTLEQLVQRVDAIQASGSAAPAEAPSGTARILPVNADNPAISFVVDTELATDRRSSYQSLGFPDGTNFSLQNAELFLSAPIDPFLRGYASINGTSTEGFNVEEAALITTALPWNLTVKGGRFFADFGRLPHWHDEALPFVDRPPSIDRLIGGESGAEGAEVSWLAPTDQYIEVTAGAYNAVGAEYLDELNSNGFFGRRDIGELTYLVHPHTYVDLTDTVNLELGASWLGVPSGNDHRNLWGFDVTLRHQPGTSGFYQGLVWGTEWLWNEQRFTERDADGNVIGRMQPNRNGGYSYVEAFFGRRYSAGLRYDRSEAPDEATDLANTVSAFVTWKPSEFQRLRFQVDDVWGDQPSNQRFTVQWTAFLGSHSHGFAQR